MSYVINGNSYEFNCWGKSNRSGFTHDCVLTLNGEVVSTCHAQYYNRTWESYRFRSVMQGAIWHLIEDEDKRLEKEFKAYNGYSRMTKSRENEFVSYVREHGAKLSELRELYDKI